MWFLFLRTFRKALPLKAILCAGLFSLAWVWATPSAAALPTTVTFRNFFDTLSFDRPLLFVQFPDRDSTYMVVQQSGALIRVEREEGVWKKSVFDSIPVGGVNSPSVTDDGGLVGFVFHPDYRVNRRYYVYYVAPYSQYPNPGRIFFAQREADSTLLKGSGKPQRVLLTLAKPYIYHNGGTLAFGKDGYLYTAIGDGGGAGDPQGRAQNKGVLFGKFLRLDVSGRDDFISDTTRNYGIPPGNPFVDSTAAGYLPEIWALGLRSPWKWSFHPATGEIWLGDIGQSTYEEVTRVPRGANLGWRIREAAFCYSAASCDSTGLTPPVLTISRARGQAVTGGRFFWGDSTSAYHGAYVFGDFAKNTVWAMRQQNGTMIDTVKIGTVNNVVSINQDSRGRLFALSMSTAAWNSLSVNTGRVLVLESPDMRLAPETPVSLPGSHVPQVRPTAAEIARNPDHYQFYGLDGKVLRTPPTGLFLVREKGSPRAPFPMSGIH